MGEIAAHQQANSVADALAAYDATPRIESQYKPAFDRLKDACLAAGMHRYERSVVGWAREFTA